MIKINLLESVTDLPTGAAMVEERVTNPRVQTLLLGLTVFGILVLASGYEYASSKSAHDTAQRELETQRRINLQMLAVNKEQAELEKKTQDIQGRIDAIKKLRESQQGPGAVLREIKARFDSVPGLYLKSIEQNNGELTIKGESPNEASVTRFGQSLEFSSGVFTNFNIETERQVVGQTQANGPAPAATSVPIPAVAANNPIAEDANAVKPEVVSFTLKCNYTTQKPQSQPAANPPGNQVAKK
jgi:Tfp pilus assembly protein PilN